MNSGINVCFELAHDKHDLFDSCFKNPNCLIHLFKLIVTIVLVDDVEVPKI